MQFQWIIVIDSLNDKNYWAYKAGAPAAEILHDLRQELQLSAQQGELRSGHVLIGDDEAVPAGIYKFYRDSGSPRVPYSHEEWEELLCGKLFGLRDQNTPAVLAKILEADVQHPHVIADMDITELEQLLGDQVPADVAHWFHDLCSLYAAPRTFAQILSKKAPNLAELNASQNLSSSGQSNKAKYGHPEYVHVWPDFDSVIEEQLHQAPVTRAMFPPTSELMSTAIAGEALIVHIFQHVDMLLRYVQYKVLRVSKSNRTFEWTQQAWATNTDSEDKYSTDSEPESEQHFNKQAYGQEKFRRRNERRHDATVQDHALRMRQGKKTVLLYETKKPQEVLDPLAEYSIPQLVEMWRKHPECATVHSQVVVDILCQATEYAAIHGCRYVMFGSYRWSWAGKFTQAGHLLLAGPFRCTQSNPTLLQIVYTLSCRAIQEPRHNSWKPLARHPNAKSCSNSNNNSNSRHCSRRHSRWDSEPDEEGRNSAPDHDAAPRGSMPTSSGGQAQQQPPTSTTRVTRHSSQQQKKNSACADDAPSEQQQPQDQLLSNMACAPLEHKATTEGLLAAVAAAADSSDILGVIGHGIMGDVFLLRLHGKLTAVKLGFNGTEAAAALAHEGNVLLTLQPLWGTYIPPLVALGAAFGQDDYILATQYVRGRQLRPADDAHLLPQLQEALQAVHGLGILHGDIRRQNILVSVESGRQRVWLIDFGYAKQQASESEFNIEMEQLAFVFASSMPC